MRAYHFSECPYPEAWSRVSEGSIRVTCPNRYFDPKLGADLLNQRLDEWVLADELGLDIMINEHRSTSTCLTVSCIPPLAILSRQTKRARLLILGATIGIRQDPIQLAEELAYIDVVSRGRLEMGLVKGFPAEVAPANANPAHAADRFWEAHDLILKAMTHRDGPFNWEGRFFQYRQVNIWPRPYQQPHPPVWITCFSPASAANVAERGHIVSGSIDAKMARTVFDAYRKRSAEIGRPNPPADRFSYLSLVGVGSTEQEGLQRLAKIRGWVWSSGVTPRQFGNPPGFNPVAANVRAMRSPKDRSPMTHAVSRAGRVINPSTCPPQDLVELGVGFGGTPDQVFNQVRDLYHYVGGFGHLLTMMQGGDLDHAETTDSMRLFAREVLPRLRELGPADPEWQEQRLRA